DIASDFGRATGAAKSGRDQRAEGHPCEPPAVPDGSPRHSVRDGYAIRRRGLGDPTGPRARNQHGTAGDARGPDDSGHEQSRSIASRHGREARGRQVCGDQPLLRPSGPDGPARPVAPATAAGAVTTCNIRAEPKTLSPAFFSVERRFGSRALALRGALEYPRLLRRVASFMTDSARRRAGSRGVRTLARLARIPSASAKRRGRGPKPRRSRPPARVGRGGASQSSVPRPGTPGE